MPTPELKLKFDAVYYHVIDMEKSIAFYRHVLGFRLTSRDYVARFDLDGVLFELVPNPHDNVLPGTGNARFESWGRRHPTRHARVASQRCYNHSSQGGT